MKLLIKRTDKQLERTISELYIDDVFFSNILEDVDRGLNSKMSLEEISKLKVHSKTAIPTGTYKIIISYSPRFKRQLPLLLNVPGYSGIRIHPGNTEVDTEGCLLPGIKSKDKVISSRATFDKLFSKLLSSSKKEEIIVSIQ